MMIQGAEELSKCAYGKEWNSLTSSNIVIYSAP